MRKALLIALLAMLAVPSLAAAGPLDDYRRNGSIDPCRYSDRQLRDGLNGLPPDVQQYAPGLTDSLSAGREGCGGASPGSSDTRALESVPGPADGAGGGAAGGGAAAKAEVPAPPAPKVTRRLRLADLETPAVTARQAATLPAGSPRCSWPRA